MPSVLRIHQRCDRKHIESWTQRSSFFKSIKKSVRHLRLESGRWQRSMWRWSVIHLLCYWPDCCCIYLRPISSMIEQKNIFFSWLVWVCKKKKGNFSFFHSLLRFATDRNCWDCQRNRAWDIMKQAVRQDNKMSSDKESETCKLNKQWDRQVSCASTVQCCFFTQSTLPNSLPAIVVDSEAYSLAVPCAPLTCVQTQAWKLLRTHTRHRNAWLRYRRVPTTVRMLVAARAEHNWVADTLFLMSWMNHHSPSRCFRQCAKTQSFFPPSLHYDLSS